jgi:hypothetical protein
MCGKKNLVKFNVIHVLINIYKGSYWVISKLKTNDNNRNNIIIVNSTLCKFEIIVYKFFYKNPLKYPYKYFHNIS